MHPLVARIRSVVADPFLVAPDDLDAESRENTYLISSSLDECRSVRREDVTAALRFVAAARRRVLQEGAWEHTMTFYAWHDEQAGQLRLSTRSCGVDALPFGAALDTSATLDDIVASFVTSPYLEGIPWSELSEDTGQKVEPPPYVLPVYVEELAP